MAKNKLEEKVQEQGFKLEPTRYIIDQERMQKIGWKLSEFKKDKEGENPELHLTIRQHKKYGINIILTSIPWDRTYHFATGSPVDEKEALMLFNGYLSSAKKGRKYRGK